MKKTILLLTTLATMTLADTTPKVLTDNGCLACHNVMGQPKSAPSFRGVARKNSKWYGDNAKDKIMESITKGSQGKYRQFNNTKMPPYPNLSQEQLEQIATWILSNWQGRGNAQGMGRGNGMGNGMGRGNQGGI